MYTLLWKSLFTTSQNKVDHRDVDQIITDAYNEAIHILSGLEILDLLKEKRVLSLKPLIKYMFKKLSSRSKMYDYSYKISHIDNEDIETFDNDDDYADSDDQDDTREILNITIKDFFEAKVFDTIESHMKDSYFKITINGKTKYLYKQTACWLLIGDKNKFSNDPLLRVQQTNKEE